LFIGIDLRQSDTGATTPRLLLRRVLEDAVTQSERSHEDSIRMRAKRMWQEAGSPFGREDEYLERARELQAIVEHPDAGLLPNPTGTHRVSGATGEPIEEAALLENLGEFPGRTDQGDRVPAPMTKQKARDFARDS
jgi:DUF2934 family protein